MKSLVISALCVIALVWLFWPHNQELAPGVEPRCEQQTPRYCPDPYHVEHGNGRANVGKP